MLAGPVLAHAQAADTAVEEIVVTGSRIKRDTFSAPTPIATVSSETIQDSGNVILGDVLMDLPMVNANSNAQNTSSTLFNAGQARIDLRGLGASRTLVLVDGRRHVFSDAASPAVDLNMIPSLMVERVDVVPGAGSAVYGSEAIAGVVNLIMLKKYDGLKLDVQTGVSEEGDAEEYRIGGLWGGKFLNDRLNVVVGAEVARQEGIMQKDRDWAIPGVRRDNRPGVTPQPVIMASRSNTSPYATFQLIGGSNAATARAVTLDVRDPTQVTALSAACRTPTVLSTCQDESLFYSAVLNQLQNETSRGAVRGYADYALTERVNVFGELSFAKAKAYGVFQPAFSSAVGGGTMPVALKGDNAYLNGTTSTAAQLRAAWLGAGKTLTAGSTAQVGKFWTEFGGRNVETDRETIRAVVGMNGDFDALDRNVSWDWYAQYGKTTGDTISYGVPNVQKVQWATDAILVGGNVVCRATTVAATAAAAAGCVPWDLVNGASKGAIDYANAVATTTADIKQTVVAGNITTDLFTLPAGAVGIAVGAEYRKEESTFKQDPLSATPGALFFNAIGTRAGEYDSKDIYGEIRIPVLKDLKWTHDLTVEAAGRVSDYSTIGTAKQWRLAGEWAPIRDIRFRANKGTSVRAPNIVELFSPQSVNFTAANDPCDKSQYGGLSAAVTATRVANCSAAIAGYNKDTFTSNIGTGRSSLQLQQGGNPDLNEEKATTTQVGVVLQPRFLPGFQLAFDWYKSDIMGQVGTIPVQTLLTNLCYDSTTAYASNPFCAQVIRDATGNSQIPPSGVAGGVSRVILVNQNVAAVKIEGWDSSAQYQFPLASLLQVSDDVGDINLRVDLTRQYHWKLQGLPGQAFTELANSIPNATPEWKANMAATWSGKNLRVQWQTRFIGSMAVATPATLPSSLDPYYTEDHFEHDVRATYRFSEKLAFRAGVVNVTNERPPYLPETFSGTGTGSSTYDNRGRFFFLGASMTY